MRLFEINRDDGTVDLNKAWIMLVPEFAALFKRDKGSEGDYRGDKKLQTRKEITFIYFYTDFTSPITDWEEEERYKEALRYSNLETVDDKVMTANDTYAKLQVKAARSLKSYRVMLKSLDAMDSYLENLDMTKTDKMGKLLNDPGTVAKAVRDMAAMHTAVADFRKRTEEELKDASTGIRGMAELGDNEERVKKFSEADVISGSASAASGSITGTGTMNNMLNLLNQMSVKEVFSEEELKDELEEAEDV